MLIMHDNTNAYDTYHLKPQAYGQRFLSYQGPATKNELASELR